MRRNLLSKGLSTFRSLQLLPKQQPSEICRAASSSITLAKIPSREASLQGRQSWSSLLENNLFRATQPFSSTSDSSQEDASSPEESSSPEDGPVKKKSSPKAKKAPKASTKASTKAEEVPDAEEAPKDSEGSEATSATATASVEEESVEEATVVEEKPWKDRGYYRRADPRNSQQMAEAVKEAEDKLTNTENMIQELRDMLASSDAEIERHKLSTLRTLADMENLMKRSEREMEKIKKFAVQDFVKSLLEVADSLELASESVQKEAESGLDKDGNEIDRERALSLLRSLLQGVNITNKILEQALKKNGVTKYRPVGEPFDPNFHSALFEIPDASVPAGSVAVVTKTGYMLRGRVVRPAEVGVAKAPEES